MRRFLPHLWAGSGLLAALLTCSCQHNRCCCCSKCHAPATATMTPSLASAAAPIPGVLPPEETKAPDLPVVSPTSPVLHTAAKQSASAPEKDQDSAPVLTRPADDVPTQASEHFGHDPNYRWLVGTLDFSRIQGAWLLRYVSYEDDDRYGGCVTLVGALPSASLQKGKTVRVEGSMIDPDSRQLRPAYQVVNIRAGGS